MKGKIGLYATFGPEEKKHSVVLYMRHDTDWTRKQRVANGNTGKPLCEHDMTKQASSSCEEGVATCFKYKDISELVTDIYSFGINKQDAEKFIDKSLPYLQKSGKLSGDHNNTSD